MALLAALMVPFVGCGTGSPGGGKPQVVATTGILADITRQIAGHDATVTQLIPDSASPHGFQISAQDRAGLEDAVLLVANGANLEAGIPLDEVGIARFELAENAGALLPFEAADGETPSGEDPHVWMDPSRVAAAAPALGDELAQADPANANGYRRRAAGFAARLLALDAELERRLSTIPQADRKLITSHDALGYFADRYGFEVIASAFPASGPEAEASAAAIQDLTAAIEESGVPAVFAEQTDDPQALEQVAGQTGVEVVSDLLVESPGAAGSYVKMLRRDAQLIGDALGPP